MKIKHVVALISICILNCGFEYGATKYILVEIQLHSVGANSVKTSSQLFQNHEIDGRNSEVTAGSKSMQFTEMLCEFHVM